MAYRKALAWLGHSSSQMLDLYYRLHDEDSQGAMMALAESADAGSGEDDETSPFEGTSRAMGQSKIEKTLQAPEVQGLVERLSDITERAGFEPAVPEGTLVFETSSISHSDTSPCRARPHSQPRKYRPYCTLHPFQDKRKAPLADRSGKCGSSEA